MSDYDKYVSAVNKIFEISAQMKVNWQDQDNINYLDSIEEYRQIVIENANLFSREQPSSQPQPQVTEELADD